MKQLVSTHELAGNYTVVIDTTQDKVYLDVLDYDRPGITMESNMQGSLMMDFAEMLSKYNIKPYPNVYNITDATTGSPDAYDSLESVKYRARVIRVEDNKLRAFAPIILTSGEQIPDVFILYRKDLFSKPEDAVDEIVAVVDLHNNNIAEYIQPKDYAYAYIRGNSRYLKGIDSSTGQFVKADMYSDSITKNEYETERLIYHSYKDRRLIYNNIINLSFIIRDDNAFTHTEEYNAEDSLASVTDTCAYVYWGRYANASPISTEDVPDGYITIEDDSSVVDDRSEIFIYKPKSETISHNRIEYVGSKQYNIIGSDSILLKHHDSGYEAVKFTGSPTMAFVKYDTKHDVDEKDEPKYPCKYVDLDRFTYTIDSYVEKLPSMSFEWPTTECSLSITMELRDAFVRYVNAVSNIDIKWVKTYRADDDPSICIALDSRMSIQIDKFRTMLSPYFNVVYSDSSNIVTVTSRGDNVLNFDKLSFTKTSRLNIVGIYPTEDLNPEETIKYRKLYRYSFTSKDIYAKVVRDDGVDLISEAKTKYVELSDIGNTYIHDSIHECFSDYEFYYVRTGQRHQEVPHYKEGGTITGNALSFYTMKKSLLCSISHVPVADVVDIRSITSASDELTDDMPIDIKTRVAWCDYSSVNKHGENSIPSVAYPAGLIDVYSAAVSEDSWSYGQLLYNSDIRREKNNIYFKTTHFKSKAMEDAYIASMFDGCFIDVPWYKEHRVDLVHMVMKCMCYYDNNAIHPVKEAPLLVFDDLDGKDCVASRFRESIKDTELLKGDDNQKLTDSQQQALLVKIGRKMQDISINNMSTFFTSYLDDCEESVLNDITVEVHPVLYDDELFCMLYGVPFKVDITTSEYTYKSIIIPCQRFALRLQEDTRVYPKSLTRIIRNDKAKQIIIATFIDIPVIMPFAMGVEHSNEYMDSTMFGNFERNYLAYIGANTNILEDSDSVDSLDAFNVGYVNSTADLDGDYIYKQNKTSITYLACINYIADFNIDKDIKNITDDNQVPMPEDYDPVIAARAIATGTSINIALVGYARIIGDDGSIVLPGKIVFFDKSDEGMSHPLGYFYTVYAADDFVHPQALIKMNDAGITNRNFEAWTPNYNVQVESVRNAIDAMMVPFDDTYNRYIRNISNENIDDYKFVAVVIEAVTPGSLKSGDGYIHGAKNVLEYSGAYYYFNSIMAAAAGIYEYVSNKDIFLKTKTGELNSAITYTFSSQCYPSSNQLLTYDIVDGDVVTEPYNRITQDDPTGILYDQYITVYDEDNNTVQHKVSLENIFDDAHLLTVPLEDYSNTRPMLNYRTQRFKSLVVYDRTYISAPQLVTNINKLDSILASKLYAKDGKWINVKVNRSSVDIKFYPSIMYGETLRRTLTKVCKHMNVSDDPNVVPQALNNDDYIMYVDNFMFHLYDYELNVYKMDTTNEFNIYAQKDSKSTRVDYDVKKNYDQEYRNIPKQGIFITYKMSLRV